MCRGLCGHGVMACLVRLHNVIPLHGLVYTPSISVWQSSAHSLTHICQRVKCITCDLHAVCLCSLEIEKKKKINVLLNTQHALIWHIHHLRTLLKCWKWQIYTQLSINLKNPQSLILMLYVHIVCLPPGNNEPAGLDLKIRYLSGPAKAFNQTRQLLTPFHLRTPLPVIYRFLYRFHLKH